MTCTAMTVGGLIFLRLIALHVEHTFKKKEWDRKNPLSSTTVRSYCLTNHIPFQDNTDILPETTKYHNPSI